MGTGAKDKSLATTVRIQSLLTSVELEQLYLNGLPRRFVDSVADEMLRHRVTITLGSADDNSDETISVFEEFLKNAGFHQAYAEVVKLQRLYGGAGLVMLIDDGLPEDEPVDVKRIRGIRGFIPLSRWELIPTELTGADYSRPEFYLITTSQKLTDAQREAYVNVRIHHTRVARFDGLYLPWKLRITNTGWGQSVIQLLWHAYKRYESALSGLENMMSDSDLFVHKMPGLFNRLAQGNEDGIRKRLETNSMSRSIYGGVAIDTEEDVNFISRSLANISSATDPFVTALQAETGWPASILMGESPGGLGTEGRFQERVWSSLVEQWQEVYCRHPLTEVFTYIFASREGPTGGKPPKSWAVHFPSVFTQTDEDKAALRANVAATDVQYINSGVLNAIEIRQSRFGGTSYGLETTLNEAVTEQMAAQADTQFQNTLLSMQAQQDAMLNPQPQADPNQPAPPEGEPPADPTGGGIFPDAAAKQDAFDLYEARGLRIRVTHSAGGVRAGYLVGPDGQRTDSSAEAPLVVFGPQRARTYRLYRASFAREDELTPGPYVTGFATLRAARQGLQQLWPRQTVAGLTPIPEVEAESLKAGWEVYA
jgi:phage-related protein (TIGR01555 family)